VSAPNKLTIAPMIHAAKNISGVPALEATSDGVLKIPIPITRLITMILKSKTRNLGFIDCCVTIL
jgi:hypothetical protein